VGLFTGQCLALKNKKDPHVVFVDEVQAVPSIFDAVQHLYDKDKTRWRFVLCGSSARKLRKAGTNLLPGRSFLHRLFPLILCEYSKPSDSPHGAPMEVLPFSWTSKDEPKKPFPSDSLENRLAFGDLPGVVTAEQTDRADLLKGYVFSHLQEEIRREGLVRDWGAFIRFLELAATESGRLVNYAAISQESGIPNPTIKSHYQLLEDMFIGFAVPAFSKSSRKIILSTPKFIFFDLGIRHASAGLTPSLDVVRGAPGNIFEQWVGIELWKRLQYLGSGRLFHQRTKDGAEIDYIIEKSDRLIPLEVKWTDRPSLKDARHLLTFLKENDNAPEGFIVCRVPHPVQLNKKIKAIPWFAL